MPSAPSKYDSTYGSAHKHHASDYAERDSGCEYKRQTYVPEADMSRSVGWHVSESAPHWSCDGRKPGTVGPLDQYLTFGWHDAVSFDLIVPGDGDYRSVGRSRVRTGHRAYSARLYHIEYRGARFNAYARVHDVPFVESAEDEWSVVRLGRAYV